MFWCLSQTVYPASKRILMIDRAATLPNSSWQDYYCAYLKYQIEPCGETPLGKFKQQKKKQGLRELASFWKYTEHSRTFLVHAHKEVHFISRHSQRKDVSGLLNDARIRLCFQSLDFTTSFSIENQLAPSATTYCPANAAFMKVVKYDNRHNKIMQLLLSLELYHFSFITTDDKI